MFLALLLVGVGQTMMNTSFGALQADLATVESGGKLMALLTLLHIEVCRELLGRSVVRGRSRSRCHFMSQWSWFSLPYY